MTMSATKTNTFLEFKLARNEVGTINRTANFTETMEMVNSILSIISDEELDGEHGVYVLMLSCTSGADIPFDVGKASRTYRERFDASWRNKVCAVLSKMMDYLSSKGISQNRRVFLWSVHTSPKFTKKRELFITDLENVLLQQMAHHANPLFFYSQKNVRNQTKQLSNPLYRVRGVECLRGSRRHCYTGSPGGRLSADEIKLGDAFSKAFRW